MQPAAASELEAPCHAGGPKGSPVFGHLSRMRDDPLGLLTEAGSLYGDIVPLRLVFKINLLVNPEHIKRVLQGEHSRKYAKGKLYDRIKPLIGEGLLSSEGDHWVRQRRLVQPAFRPRFLDEYARVMDGEAKRLAARWAKDPRTRGAFNVMPHMTDVTLRVIGKTMLGIDLDAAIGSVLENLPTVLTTLNERFQQLLYLPFLPTPKNLAFNRALRALDGVVNGIIEERRAAGPKEGDFLSSLIWARDEDGSGMTPKQLRDEVMTMLLAGHETTSNALAWTLSLLSLYPEAQEAAAKESAATAGLPPVERVGRLAYVKAAIQEAMRIYPPVWLLGRFVVEDDVIDGVRIPKGSAVFLSPYVTHRHPRFWERASEYLPERFLDGAKDAIPPYAYFPFSGGPRNCIGERFATMEAQLILAEILAAHRVLPVPGVIAEPEPSVTLRPKGGVYLRLVPR